MNRITPPLLTLFILFSTLAALGQKGIPSYGKVDKEDLQMTTCDLDPDADAYILIKTGETTYSLGGDEPILETVYRYRVKILKDKGTGRSNIRIRYYTADRMENIDGISGVTYNLDAGGNIVKSKLDQSNVYVKQLDKYFSETVFTLPDVRKGSVIEYQFTKNSKYFTEIDPWNFQDEIPTRICRFYLSIPQYFDFTYNVTAALPVEQKDETVNEAARSFTMKNIPALKEEPYMSARRDFLQHIDFQLAGIEAPGHPYVSYRSDWLKLNEELLRSDHFGAQLHKDIPHTGSLDLQLATLKDSVARMSAVYDYVRRHMNWDGVNSLYSDDGVKTAWEKKNGSITEINLILVDLLRDAGLRAYPLLVSTRDHGRVNTGYPLLTQFNETMAYVLIGGKTYVLNGADKFNPYRLIPYDVQYTQGYVIDRNNPGWVPLANNENQYKAIVLLTGRMTEDGRFEGNAQISNFDYSKNQRCESLQEGMDKFKDAYFTKGYTNLKIDSLAVEGRDDDSSPLQQTVQFTSQLNSSGGYLFFSPNLFLGLENNPFVAEQRFTDVDFGYKQSYMVTGNLEIPDGYKYESLPKNLRMIMQDTSISLVRMMQADGNMVNFRITLDFKRPVYLRDEYGDFREFYKRLYAMLNEPIVIRKK
jgi:hypothetical protein